MLEVVALGPAGEYRTRNRVPVPDAAGHTALELSVVPGLVLSDWITVLRGSDPLPATELTAVLEKAADVFEGEQILGDTLDTHERRVAGLTGNPLAVVRECDRLITAQLRDVWRSLHPAVPAGCTTPSDEPVAGAAWCRAGDVFAVSAAGNSPGVHALWLQALALGYRVVVRPSNRDPLTGFRLVSALRQAGLPDRQVVLAPTDHGGADALVDRADRAVVYGGRPVVNRYRDRRDVLPQGPGRSKLVVTDDADRRAGLDLAVEGVLHHAGTACTSTTGILVEEDVHGFAADLAAALGRATPALPWQEDAVLPAMPEDDARRLVAGVLDRVDPDAVWLRPRAERTGVDGMAVVTPAVVELSSPRDPLLGYEMPFPCAWVAPFERGGLTVLKDSLVVSLNTTDTDLARRILDFPSVANVYLGRPTSWQHPDVPHDSFLGEFLMRSKGFARGQ